MPNAHTPGPWKVSEYHKAVTTAEVSRDGCVVTICELPHMNMAGPTGDLYKANARLIAQAPRMLAELEEVSHWHDLLKQNYPEMVGLISAAREARAILRAVKGE